MSFSYLAIGEDKGIKAEIFFNYPLGYLMNIYTKLNRNASKLSDNKHCNLFYVDSVQAPLDITGLFLKPLAAICLGKCHSENQRSIYLDLKLGFYSACALPPRRRCGRM